MPKIDRRANRIPQGGDMRYKKCMFCGKKGVTRTEKTVKHHGKTVRVGRCKYCHRYSPYK